VRLFGIHSNNTKRRTRGCKRETLGIFEIGYFSRRQREVFNTNLIDLEAMLANITLE
jgi:hypothetical protein